jgi:hypothetical protein
MVRDELIRRMIASGMMKAEAQKAIASIRREVGSAALNSDEPINVEWLAISIRHCKKIIEKRRS